MSRSQRDALAVVDWRRQVHALYGAVRAERDPAAGHAVWIAGRTELFGSHPASPRMAGQQLRHADYDPAFRFELPMADAAADRFEASTGTDGTVGFERVGRFEFPVAGQQLDASGPAGARPRGAGLDVWWLASYGGGLFVPVRDATAGTLTYGAGRYLLDTVKGASLGSGVAAGSWVIDLNFAYNPSCVYDPRWACPLAPSGNRIDVDAPVGELLPTGH
ncbi:hypothetical protein BH10ACT8_BH10ACT8_18970 [soil metagenome]